MIESCFFLFFVFVCANVSMIQTSIVDFSAFVNEKKLRNVFPFLPPRAMLSLGFAFLKNFPESFSKGFSEVFAKSAALNFAGGIVTYGIFNSVHCCHGN